MDKMDHDPVALIPAFQLERVLNQGNPRSNKNTVYGLANDL